MKFDPEQLNAALGAVPQEAWSLPSTYLQTGVHHGYRRVVLVNARQPQEHAHHFQHILDSIAPVWEAWLSWIDPGGFITPHRDAGPWRERWQIPIQPAGDWRGEETFQATAGVAFPVKHWDRHAVVNPTDHPRIHVVIDRDVWLDRPPEPFKVYPIPDDMTDMVLRSLQ